MLGGLNASVDPKAPDSASVRSYLTKSKEALDEVLVVCKGATGLKP